MTDATSPHNTAPEHGHNPDPTPLSPALELLSTSIDQWRQREREQLPGLFIRALAQLSQSNPDQASAGFNPLEIREAIQDLRPGWMPDATPDDISRRVRELYTSATVLFERKQEHLAQCAPDLRSAFIPTLDRSSGGGSGHLTHYRFLSVPIESPQVPDDTSADARPVSPDSIRYRCEDSRTAKFLGNIAAGVELRGLTSWVYLGLGMAGMLATLAICGLAVILAVLAPTSTGTLPLMFTAALVFFFAWRWGFPLFQVLDVRILSAPGWIQLLNVDEDLLLEWRRPPRHPERRLQLVRYSGACPVCGAKVRVQRLAWHSSAADLIGRCEEAPRAHRFTFDHITRWGHRIGHTPDPDTGRRTPAT